MSAWTVIRSRSKPWVTPFWEEGGPEPVDQSGDDDLVHLILDSDHSANALSESVLDELAALLPDLAEAPARALIVWSGKAKHFIAGADIDEIDEIHFPETATGKAAKAQRVLTDLGRLPMPTFAAIRGTCLGGGLELALALDYRVAVDDPSTKLGLPEVNLGIIPGFGGTQRLPRLIGIRRALALILGGSRLPAAVAGKRGVVDVVVPTDGYVDATLRFVEQVTHDGGRSVEKRRRRFRGGWTGWFLEGNPVGRALIRRQVLTQVQQKTGGHYPAPGAALDAVLRGAGTTLERGLEIEAELLGPLVAGAVSKNLITVFRASEEARKLRQWADEDGEIPTSATVGVLGSGVMGAGVATNALDRGFPVRIRDLDWKPIQSALESIGGHCARRVQRKRWTPRERDAALSRLTYTTQPVGFETAGIVIEAIVERMDVKKKALREIEPNLAPESIFATNTSALSVTELQAAADRPERVVGLHFFNPVERMPLVEVIPGRDTAPWAVAQTARFAVALGKYPVVVQDRPGFIVNRLLMPYLDSACRILESGVPGQHIDRIAVRFGLPMGPLRLLDEVGLDVAVEVADTLHAAFGDRAEPCLLLQQIREKELLGKKGGLGFYRYESGVATAFNEELATNRSANDLPEAKAIVDYLLDRMIDEAARALDEGVIGSAEELDLAMVMGTGFPPFRGGLLRYADAIGLPGIVERLSERAESGENSAPCEALVALAKEGGTFHGTEGRGTQGAKESAGRTG